MTIGRLQRCFRTRLGILKDSRRPGILARHARERYRWQAGLAEARAWNRQCSDRTCALCGSPKRPRALCHLCQVPAGYGWLQEQLRRLAGIGNGHACVRTEWDGWNDGKGGAQNCGPAAWDLAVRIWEDG